jgi:hypothetical protein
MGRPMMALAVSAALVGGAAHAGTLTAGDITNPATQFFNPVNGHIYEVVNSAVTWTEALNAARQALQVGRPGSGRLWGWSCLVKRPSAA